MSLSTDRPYWTRTDFDVTISGEPLPHPDSEGVHSFLLNTDYGEDDPAEVALALLDYIESLPDYTATFTLSSALDDTEYSHNSVKNGVLYLFGSWKSTLSGKSRWVNPNYDHREGYTDVLVYCDCGAPVTRVKNAPSLTSHDFSEAHEDGCTLQSRYQARADLCEARAKAMRQSLQHGHSARSMSDRLGACEAAGREAVRLGIDITALKEEFRRKRANTIPVLLTRHSAKEVARLYDLSASYIRRIVAEETPYVYAEFSDYREANHE